MKYVTFLSVVMFLGSAQWLMVTSLPSDDVSDPPPKAIVLNNSPGEIMRNIPWNEATDELYQGDMVLTDEQRQELVARKAIKNVLYRWPKSADGTVNIDYRFADTVVSRTGVVAAMLQWEQATCVKFNEIPAQVEKPHLIFITHTTACSSNVGQVYFQNGQNVNLMPSCFNGGTDTVVHELGHALGLWHEQSRSDRDDYLYIMFANVIAGMEHNFNKEDSNNYGLPYDYTSIMQYSSTAFSKNGLNTIVAKDPLAQPLIRYGQDLSFMDKKIVNLMYNCTDTWLAKCKLTVDPCKYQGYTKSDCLCACPAGTSGANCETLNLSYIDALINATSPGSQRITTAGTVTSPGYPKPVTTATTRVQSIVAPACHKVKLTFNVFDMQGMSTLTSSANIISVACWYMILEIKLDDPPVTGTQYCGANITATQTFVSVGRLMVLTFSTRALASNTKTGYSATVEFVPVTTGNCTPTTTTPTTTSTTTPTTTSTTTAAFSPGTFINSGSLSLIPSNTILPCSLVPTANPSISLYRSPNYPSNYSSGQQCTTWFNTTEPRYLMVTPMILTLGLSDRVELISAYKNTTYLDAKNVGTVITLLTSSSRLAFQDSLLSPTGRFILRLDVVNTDCHQLIKLDARSTGPLSIPANYPPGTICEWWLRAPAGRQVRVSFSSFSIGASNCLTDYVVMDLTGDSRYLTKSTRYCGENAYSPGTVVSTGNALNILVNGKRGNYQGLKATYTVV